MGVLRSEEADIIRHSLGIGRGNHRNYFCAGEGHADMPQIESLIALGFMRTSHTINEGRDTIYVVTDAGRDALNKKV